MTLKTGVAAQWHDLVTDAQSETGISLALPVESYLVNTLIHYTQRTDITAKTFAIEYLQLQQEQGKVRSDKLRELADQCLLYAGLFPQYAKRRNLNISYYVDLGRSAYFDLSHSDNSWAIIFAQLCENFVSLMDTLLAIHHIDNPFSLDYILAPEQALDTWQRTQSSHAFKLFKQQTQSENIVPFSARKKIKNTDY